jgi:hypothetical protein
MLTRHSLKRTWKKTTGYPDAVFLSGASTLATVTVAGGFVPSGDEAAT